MTHTALVAVVVALCSALTFGLSTSLQHRAATTLAGVAPRRLLGRLVRRREWQVGICLSILAFGLHAWALGTGPLSLVQPVIISGVVFAVLVRSALDRRWPSRRELGWVALTWAGLILFIGGTGASASTHLPAHAPVVTAVLAVAAALATRCGARAATPEGRGLWLGIGAGILFGLVAAMIKLALVAASHHAGPLSLAWPLTAMLVAGLWAVALNQRAYQTTRLSVSMPVLNVVDVLVALGFAAIVLGERPGLSPAGLAAQCLGLVALTWGVRELARSEERDDRVEGPGPHPAPGAQARPHPAQDLITRSPS